MNQTQQNELELQALNVIDQALRSIDEQLMAGHIDTARNVLRYAIADTRLLKTLLKNRPQDATDNLEP